MLDNKVVKFINSFREGTLILIIVALSIFMTFMASSFLTTGNIRATVLSFAIDGFVVIGMTLVLVSGGIDLSVGSIIALVGTIVGQLYLSMEIDIWIASGIGLIIAVLLGGINGVFVTKVGLDPAYHNFSNYGNI